MGSSLSDELEEGDTKETQGGTSGEPGDGKNSDDGLATPQQQKHQEAKQEPQKKQEQNIESVKSSKRESFAEVKEEDIADLNYIKPSSEEISKQKELHLIHICHHGHYSQNCKWSAQNLLQNNNALYQSLKSYNFDINYNKCDHDWIIFKINSKKVIKCTQFSIDLLLNDNNLKQYPFKLCIQFMINNDLKKVIDSGKDSLKWSKPYFIKPSIFKTNKNNKNNEENKEEMSDTFTITFAAEYFDELYNNRYCQYIRISLLESYSNDECEGGKYLLNHFKLYGIPYLDDNNKEIEIDNNNDNNLKTYKYEIKNNFSSNLSPKPGKNDARILMRDHIFFINVGNKTISVLKNIICEEYDRLNEENENEDNNKYKYNAKQIILVLDGYGFINDMMDTTVLNKTLSQIGVKPGQNNTGYYITVGFC